MDVGVACYVLNVEGLRNLVQAPELPICTTVFTENSNEKALFFCFENWQFRKPTQVVKLHSYFLNPGIFTVIMVEVFIQQAMDLLDPPVLVLYGAWTKLTRHRRLIVSNPPSGGLSWRASGLCCRKIRCLDWQWYLVYSIMKEYWIHHSTPSTPPKEISPDQILVSTMYSTMNLHF